MVRNQLKEIKKDQIRIDESDGEVINCIEECTKSWESKICGELRREESKEESEQLERSGDMEEKVGGEIKKKFKENGDGLAIHSEKQKEQWRSKH